MLQQGDPGSAYNAGSQEAVILAELARRVGERLAPGKRARILGKAGSDNAAQPLYPDVSRARDELNFQNRIGLDEAIQHAGARILRSRRSAGI